jgi:2-polyprenyl-3-methyl-5-hydroxy-6-metoxy-1,4-benzoquinol methylase
MKSCLICQAELGVPIYTSSDHRSLTTMLSPCDGQTNVYFCDACGHLQTAPIVDVQEFYSHTYSILADSEDEDQLYKVVEGRNVFQTEHRASTFLKKVRLPEHGRIVDIGCGKGMVLREICRRKPNVRPCFFELSDRYVRYWKNVAQPEQWATHIIPECWKNQFDAVTSFYVLEHVDDPVEVIRRQSDLLKPGGALYFIVPNVYANTADLVVADHLQHYSENSLIHLLDRCGLETMEVDDESHESAFVVVARRIANPRPFREPKRPIAELKQQVVQMSRFWSGLSGRIRAFEQESPSIEPACIYGAGFYGNFIVTCLKNRDSIQCFVDQNRYLQQKPMQGKPVIAPHELDLQIRRMYVGLNPRHARAIIESIETWNNRHFDYFYV